MSTNDKFVVKFMTSLSLNGRYIVYRHITAEGHVETATFLIVNICGGTG